jgi:hypothetical protein
VVSELSFENWLRRFSRPGVSGIFASETAVGNAI